MLQTESYLEQLGRWPKRGRHILAQFNTRGVIVYQAYRPAIGRFAAQHQFFGEEFKLSRMSWIKTNFLWMMHRCGWGLKADQEVVLAINIRREAFDSILEGAVHSTFVSDVYGSHDEWKQRLNQSPVRLQWDPDHDPFGVKQERRAIQLGLAGEVLRSYSHDWILNIEDISSFVAKEREHLSKQDLSGLVTPLEEVYPVNNPQVARRLGIAEPECADSTE
jgi:hypothetical protein